MDRDVIQQMRAEEADLSRKLKAVRDLLAAYGEDVGQPNVNLPASAVTQRAAPARAGAAPVRGKVSITGFGTYGRGVVAEAMRGMLTTDQPMKTRQLVDFLDAMGVAITGENKVNALGALLSRSLDIVSHGKTGWTLADRDAALQIVGEYARNENEPPEEPSIEDLLDGSETALPAQNGGPQE